MFNMIFLNLRIISYKVLAVLTQFYAGYIFTTMVKNEGGWKEKGGWKEERRWMEGRWIERRWMEGRKKMDGMNKEEGWKEERRWTE